ncbi:hypothetical protein O0I10_007565 [Lichtheimia ornata]|uniref:Pentatricopeptide repeat-containing protein-mitochondrial domain-containing protein n=1 Tax=Lichtheimia ornata TaxID=688661 RepID=A0AAD7UZW1_9FUNG|nr:uncharacterized protein O0I10_007565 [Lichtheimia ornata]KAJ8656718.1 hypothetical protein O0I10_007565 [Lichtheimia ornata]
MTTSALARRGSKCAAACKHQNPLRPNFARCRSTFVLPVVPSPITRHTDMLCLLAAAAASRATGVSSSSSSCTQRRHFNARSSSSSSAALSAPSSSTSSTAPCALNDPSHNIFHPRRIGKGCDLNALYDYLRAQGHQLGPERVYKTLRSALYNASGYQADTAWRIYQMMLEHGVSHRMGANNYGHLLNMLKYGNDWERMVNVLDNMRNQGTQVGPLHYAQVLFAMARHGQLESACKILKEMRDAGVPRQPSHLTSLALAVRSHHVSTKQHEVAAKVMMEVMQTDGIVIENRACAVMVSHLSRTSMDKTIEFLECLAQAQAIGNNKDTPATAIEEAGAGARGGVYNTHVYTSLISGLAHKGDAINAERLYNEMKHHRLRPTVATRVALAEAYGRAGDFDKALKLVGKRPNHAIMTSILSNAMRQGRWDLAHDLAETWMADKRIMNNTAADDKFRATLMWVKVKTGLDTAKLFFQRLYEEDASFVNAVMVNHLVMESGNQQKKDQVYESFGLHRQLEDEPAPSLLSHHYYVDALFKCRDVPAALAAFVEMRRYGVPDDITMAMVVRGLVMNEEDNMAWNVFRVMRKNGLQPNLYAYSSILKAFAKTQAPRWVSKELSKLWPDLHAAITGDQQQPDLLTHDFLGSSSHAYSLFQEMTGFQRPNEYTYTTLIACFAKTSLARAADVFSHMCADGIKPTAQTYTAMLQGCAIFRNARMALVVFRHMREHHVTPNQKTWHYLLKALVRARVDRKKIDSVGRMARKAMDVS